MTLTLIQGVTHWECRFCGHETVTREARPHTQFHEKCPAMGGLNVPMVQLGVKAKVETVEWQDYVGKERVQTDPNGRPVMSIVTTRDDGQDVAVYAPMATARVKEV